MIERFVFVKLKDRSLRETIAAAALELLPTVPVVRGIHVGTPADEGAEVWDLVLVVQLDRIEDVPIYADHPIHRGFVDEHLAPHAEIKKAWNFSMTLSAMM
ncbi:MAG TPA: Dabb family protein [Deltaproteobacteria bacterium]|nr:Dabb family protein [Deltaproteobacteria bacterium]